MATACIAKPAWPARLMQRPSLNSTQALHVTYGTMANGPMAYGMHDHLQHISIWCAWPIAACQHMACMYAWPIAAYAGQGDVHADDTNTYCDGPCHACVSPKVHQLGDGRPVGTRERYL